MLKEIDEQPLVIRKLIQKYQNQTGDLTIDADIINAVKQSDRLYIVAAGTSYHAGLVGAQMIEKLAKVPVEVHVASEFNYNMPILSENPLFIFISQSGETADSRAVLVQVKELGHPALTIANVQGSRYLVKQTTHFFFTLAQKLPLLPQKHTQPSLACYLSLQLC